MKKILSIVTLTVFFWTSIAYSFEEYAILAPKSGIKTDAPTIVLSDSFSPNSLNSWVHNERVDRATMRIREFADILPDIPTRFDYFEMKNLTAKLMVCTKRDIAYRDTSNDKYIYLTPQYTTGVIMVGNASDKVYGGYLIDDCDDDPVAWADRSGGDVTPSKETTTVKENSVAVKLTVVAAAGVENLASNNNAGGIDLSGYDSIGFWFRSTVNLSAGDLKLKLNDAVDLGGVDQESIDISAITANTWTWVNIAMADPSNCAAIKSWGIYQAVDKGAMDLFIDFIVAGDWAGQLGAEDFVKIGSTTASSDDTWYEVDTVDSDTDITLTANYDEADGYQQAYIARLTFAGADTDLWDSCTVYKEDTWVATNSGVDYPIYWDGSAATVADVTASFKASHCIYYEGYLVWGKLANNPQRIKWAELNDFDDYTNGDTGETDLEESDSISGFSKWQDFLVVFKEESIHLMWIVTTDMVFNRDVRVREIGCYAGFSIIAYQNKVYFWSSDNKFRAFNGLHANEEISGNIDDVVSAIPPNYEDDIYGIYIEELKQFWWAVPGGPASSYNDVILTYDLETRSWGKLDLEATCLGTYTTESDLTWDTLPYKTWEEWPGKWDDRTFDSGAPIDLMGNQDKYVYRVHSSERDMTAATQLVNRNMEAWGDGTSSAPDGWTLAGAAATIAREGATIQQGTYSAAVTRAGTDCTLSQSVHATEGIAYWQDDIVTFSCYVYATVASRARIYIADGVGTTYSDYHSGGSGWEHLTVTRTIDSAATAVTLGGGVYTGNTTAYFDHATVDIFPVDFTGYFELNQNAFGHFNKRKRLLRYRTFFHKENGETIDLSIRVDDKVIVETAETKNLDDQADRDIQEIEVICDYSGKFFGLYAEGTGPFRFIGIIYEFDVVGDR